MKKVLTITALLSAVLPAFAQNDAQKAAEEAAKAISAAPDAVVEKAKVNYWTNSIVFDLGFNQTALNDWSAGGYNNVSLSTALDAKANYKKDLMSWNNRLQMQYGFLWSADKSDILQRSTDRIYLESAWSYKTGKDSHFSYTASFNFRSQFSEGLTYNTPAAGQSWREAATLKSGFISPAYTNIALGISWVPNNWLSVALAPVTGGFTIVEIPSLRKSYGMALRDESLDPEIGTNYRSAKFQFGAQLQGDVKFTINDNFKFESQLILFSDYLDHPQNLRVNWDNKVSWQLGRFFKIGFSTWLIYDPNVLIVADYDKAERPNGTQRIQFKEFLSLNFSYTISNAKKK